MKDILNLYNNENRYYKMVEDIIKAIESHSLFLFIGAGVSIGQGYPDWNKYIDELLRFWTYRLSDVNKEKLVKREDLLFLNYIAESNMDKKRKIDIVHYLIKEYQENIDGTDSKLLDFEKMYFRELEPTERVNKTLEELVKLEATFITTNYDNQIEKHFTLHSGKNLQVYENVSKLNGRIPANSIIYLHGHPDGDPHYFINSSSSYSRLYYEENEHFNIFREFIQMEVNPTILFIGCSMEEEEILAFLNKQHQTKGQTKYYALMKYDNQPSLAKHFNEHMYQFYKNEKNIEFIWYGESHEQLPILVEDLVDKVSQKIMSEKDKDMEIIRSGGSDTVSVLNHAKDEKNFYFLVNVFDGFLKADGKDIRNFFSHLFKSEIITQGALKNAADYAPLWQLFSERIELLNEEQKNKVFCFITKIKSFNSEAILSIGRFVLKSKYNNYHGKKKYLMVIYKSMNWYNVVKELNDNELSCLYLNELLVARNRVWIAKEIYKDKFTFNYSDVSFTDLLKALDKLGDETKYYDFAYNMKFSSMSLLFNCIKHGLLQYENSYDFPDEFYKMKVVQKVFVNLDLEIPDEKKCDMLIGEIDKVKVEIDYTDKLMGKEMNEFYAKHFSGSTKEEDYFVDGITTDKLGPVEFYPYLNSSELFSLSKEAIVRTLEDSSDMMPFVGKAFSGNKHVSGQSEVFDELFTDETFEKYRDKVKEVLTLLIDNDILRQRYGSNIVTYFMKSESRILENQEILQVYLEKINSNHFTWLEKKIYEYIIGEKLYLQLDFFEKLISSYDVAQFEEEDITDEAGFVDINKFINTSIGRFFDVFRLFRHESDLFVNEYAQMIKENIEKLDVLIKNYVKGGFLDLYDTDEYQKDILFFQGAAHFHMIQTKRELAEFKHVIQPIFSSNFNDDYCIEEVGRLLIEYYQPGDVEYGNVEYLKKVSDMMFRWLIFEMDQTKYGEEWFIEFIKNELTAKRYIESLVYAIDEIPEEKYKRILSIIDEHINDTINIDSYYISFTSGEKAKLTRHSELIKILLSKKIIVQDRNFLSELESLFKNLEDNDRIDMMQQLLDVLREILTQEDYRDLSIRFRRL